MRAIAAEANSRPGERIKFYRDHYAVRSKPANPLYSNKFGQILNVDGSPRRITQENLLGPREPC